MAVFTCTTRITRQYLERKTKSDLAQMYLDLLDADIKLEQGVKAVIAAGYCNDTCSSQLGDHPCDCWKAKLKSLIGV